ncbi:MAG: radical SAM protein [Spirochaetes bacterium]|nr:radical SAM protein [Spirochaetota bacterium]
MILPRPDADACGVPRGTVVLVARHAERSPRAVALGAACAASALHAVPGFAASLDCVILDSWADETSASLAARVLALDPRAAGFSVYSWNRPALAETAALVRRGKQEALLFAGGPEATADPGGMIADFGLDIAVVGEVEAGAAGLAAAMLAGAPQGGPGAILSPTATPGPGALPSPWLDGTARPADGGVLWELARGCPYACSYCYESRGDRRVRPIPMKRMEAELERFVELGVRQAFVLDPTFNLDTERSLAILDLLIAKAPDIHYSFEIRAELVTSVPAKRFARLACSLQIGLQSAEEAPMRAVGRDFDRKAFVRGIRALESAGATYGLDLIYGLPEDTPEGFRRSLDFALKLRPNHLDLFRLSVLPGTTLAADAARFGLVAETRAPYALQSTPTFPEDELDEAEAFSRTVDLFYDRGRAVAWFLPLAEACGFRPSALLDFARIAMQGRSDAGALAPGSPGIEAIQLETVILATGHAPPRRGRNVPVGLADAASDLVRLHGAWGRALAEGTETNVELHYLPDELFGSAALDLRNFAATARKHPGSWTVKPDRKRGAAVLPGHSPGRGIRG